MNVGVVWLSFARISARPDIHAERDARSIALLPNGWVRVLPANGDLPEFFPPHRVIVATGIVGVPE